MMPFCIGYQCCRSDVQTFEVVEVDIPKEIPPRVTNQAIKMKPKTKSYVLSEDGKKLAPALNSTRGRT